MVGTEYAVAEMHQDDAKGGTDGGTGGPKSP